MNLIIANVYILEDVCLLNGELCGVLMEVYPVFL